MAYVISEDMDESIVHASIHGVLDRSGLNYYRDRLRDLGGRATGLSRRFMERAGEFLRDFDLDNIRDGLHAMRDRFGRRWDLDRIIVPLNISDVQGAKSVMRRWNMANPRLRKLWRDDVISGYNGEFDRAWDTDIGTDLLDYRKVMQGAYVGTEDEDRFITFVDVLEEVDEDVETLSFNEREIIRHSWTLIDEFLDEGLQDPTSEYKALI